MMNAGVGVSGSPMPRLMTGRPAAMAAFFFLSISANRYGGSAFRRSLAVCIGRSFLGLECVDERDRPIGPVKGSIVGRPAAPDKPNRRTAGAAAEKGDAPP